MCIEVSRKEAQVSWMERALPRKAPPCNVLIVPESGRVCWCSRAAEHSSWAAGSVDRSFSRTEAQHKKSCGRARQCKPGGPEEKKKKKTYRIWQAQKPKQRHLTHGTYLTFLVSIVFHLCQWWKMYITTQKLSPEKKISYSKIFPKLSVSYFWNILFLYKPGLQYCRLTTHCLSAALKRPRDWSARPSM